MSAVLAIARVELLRLLRTRIALTVLLVVPALQVLLFGTAIRPADAVVTVAIAGDSAGTTARAADVLGGVAGIRLVAAALPPGGAAAAVRSGAALVGIELPPAASLARTLVAPPPVRIIVDGSDPGLSGAAVARIEARYWRERAGRDAAPGLAVERLYNPGARADWSFLPGLIGVIMMISTIMLGSLSLARERETGTWEALLGLPASPAAIVAGKLLPYVVVATLQGLVVLGIAAALFDLPVRGSIAALVLLLPLFAAAHLAIGYAIAARAATQLAALQGAVAFYLPAMLLSGFLYPFATLPGWAQALGSLFPLTHFIRAARAATLTGAGAAEVAAHGLPIAAALAVATILALVASRRGRPV